MLDYQCEPAAIKYITMSVPKPNRLQVYSQRYFDLNNQITRFRTKVIEPLLYFSQTFDEKESATYEQKRMPAIVFEGETGRIAKYKDYDEYVGPEVLYKIQNKLLKPNLSRWKEG